MSDNGRISLLFLANVLLYFAIGLLNNAVSGWSLQLQLDVLLLVFFGLYLNRMLGLLYTILIGFLADAAHPGPQGAFLLGYLAIWLYLVWAQRRIRRQNPVHVRSVAGAGQALWIIGLAVVMGMDGSGDSRLLADPVYWLRVGTDLLASAAVVYLLAWPWCQFQKNLLYSLGWDIEARMSAG